MSVWQIAVRGECMKNLFTYSNVFGGALLLSLLAAAMPSPAVADTESERLAKLEAAVKALQEQNAALKREVSELKGSTPKKEVSRKTATTTTTDAKTYV